MFFLETNLFFFPIFLLYYRCRFFFRASPRGERLVFVIRIRNKICKMYRDSTRKCNDAVKVQDHPTRQILTIQIRSFWI